MGVLLVEVKRDLLGLKALTQIIPRSSCKKKKRFESKVAHMGSQVGFGGYVYTREHMFGKRQV